MKSHWPISILSSVSSLVNMALPLVLVRILTPEAIGQFKIFFLYLMIFPTFGLMTGVTNGLSYWAGRADLGRSLMRTSGRLILVTALVFLAVCLALHAPLESWLKWGPTEALVFSIAVFGAVASTFYEDSAIALGQVWQGAIFSSAWDLGRTIVILITGIATRNVLDIFIAHSMVTLLKTAVAYYLAERRLLAGTIAVEAAVSKVLEYALPVSLAGALGVFVNYSDQMLLSRYLSVTDFAFYAVGCLTVPPLTILEYSVTRVLIPQLSEAFAGRDDRRAAHLYMRAVDELSLVLIPAVAGMVIFAKPIILLLFTRKFAGAEAYLRVYSLSYLILIMPYDSIPRARGQARWIFWNIFTFSALTLGLCFLLIRSHGVFGALFGFLSAKALMGIYGVTYIRGSTGWKFGSFLPKVSLVRYTVIAFTLVPVCFWAERIFTNPMIWFFVMGPVFTIVYFVGVGLWSRWAFRHAPQNPGVMMLTQYIGLGGLERMILNLSLALKEKGTWRPSVYVFDHAPETPPGSHLGAAFEAAGIPIVYASKAKGFSLKAAFRIAQHLVDSEISVIHTHDLGALIYGAIAKLMTFGRVRLIHTQHSFVHLGRNSRYQLYEKVFTVFADKVTVVSPDTMETYLKIGVPKKKIEVIENGVRFIETNTDRKSSRRAAIESLGSHAAVATLGALVDARWILYMARLHGRKGQDRAVAVWNALDPKVRAGAALIFVGLETESGQLERLRGLIELAADRERIQYLGPSLRPELWLQSSEIFLSASEFEGMPLASIEAGGAGLSLILSEIPGHDTLVSVAKRFPLDRPDLGARAIELTLQEIGRGSQEHFLSIWKAAVPLRAAYSLERMAEAYARLYPWKR